MRVEISDADIKKYDEAMRLHFEEYLNSLAEWKVAYKEVMRERAENVIRLKLDFKLLAKESFLHHMKNYCDKEYALFEAEEILRKAAKYKPPNCNP